MNRTIKKIEEPYLKTGLSKLDPGDTVKVVTKVVEGDKSRLQTFEGVVISIQGEGMGKTVKVRKISYGVGVERTFPLHSPNVDSFEVVKKGAPRRAKLFYLRDRVGKRALKVKGGKKKIEYEALTVAPVDVAEALESPEESPTLPPHSESNQGEVVSKKGQESQETQAVVEETVASEGAKVEAKDSSEAVADSPQVEAEPKTES